LVRLPFFVMICTTPPAASAPYSVDAAGPLITSIDSMSFGLSWSRADTPCEKLPPVPAPDGP
jgi:hypothetical protein